MSYIVVYSTVSRKIEAVHVRCLIFTKSIRFYNKRGSKVYCAFLDASKAFDKVQISGLIAEPIKRQAPVAVIRILVSWYGSLQCSVVWNY